MAYFSLLAFTTGPDWTGWAGWLKAKKKQQKFTKNVWTSNIISTKNKLSSNYLTENVYEMSPEK